MKYPGLLALCVAMLASISCVIEEPVATSTPAPAYVISFITENGTVVFQTRTLSEAPYTLGDLPVPPEKNGYIFAGWYTSPDGTGTRLISGSAVSSNLSVYEHWSTLVYTITFNSQSATTDATPGSLTVSSPNLSLGTFPGAPAKDGYTFGGWYTEPNGQGSVISETTAFTANTIIYAKWVSYTYTVSYDSEGASTAASPATKTVTSPDTSVGSLPGAPRKTGYAFGGWYTEPEGGGTAFNGATKVFGNLTVYADWQDYSYTVTFDSQNANTAANPSTKTVSSPAVRTDSLPSTPIKPGYNFGGWYTEKNGGGTPFTAMTTVSDHMTVYALWNTFGYTVIFDDLGADTLPSPQTVLVGSPAYTVGSLPTDPIKSGYIFGGWYTEPEGAGSPFTGAVPVSATLTVYAKWITYNYTVSYDSAGADTLANPASSTVASPATHITALPTNPGKTGYHFGGWFTGTNGSGTEFTASSVVTSSMNVHARWDSHSYQIAFDSGDADTLASPAMKTVNSPEQVCSIMPSPPVKSGYTFMGWYSGPDGGGSVFNTLTPVTGNRTVYAKWLPNTGISTIIVMPIAGAVTIVNNSPTVAKGTAVTISVVESTYARYQWYLDSALVAGAGTANLTIPTTTLSPGVHTVMIVITDAAGSGSSAVCRFTVTN